MPIYAAPRAAPRVKQLTPADLGEMAALQAAVAAELPAEFMRIRGEDDLRGYLNGRLGAAFGIFDRDVLLATALLRLPAPDRPNPKSDPPFPIVPAADWPCHAASLENAMVLPAARGRGYQRALLRLRLAHAAAAGMKWVCSGANLLNQVSWSNLLAEELAIVGMRLDLGPPLIGLLAAFDADALATDPDDRLLVAAQDQPAHQAALRDGYVGVSFAEGTVTYRRLSARSRAAA
jgi:hypothetical protein